MSELPSGWVKVNLAEVCALTMGQSPSSKVINSEGVGFPFFQGKSEFGDIYPENRRYSDSPLRMAKASDILMSVRAPVGPVNIATEASGIGRGLCAISAEPGIHYKYVFYQLRSMEKHIASFGTGSTFEAINKSIVEKLELAIAPSNEQDRIVEKLEELFTDLDNGVEELKAARVKLGQYRHSLLKSAVDGSLTKTWREDNAGKISETGEQLLQRILKERRERWEQQKLTEFEAKGKKPPKDWQKKYPEPIQPNTSELPDLPDGWVWASIHQVSSDEPYSLAIGPFGSNLKVSDYRDVGVPLVFVRNIRASEYGNGFTKFVSAEKAKELMAHSVSAGDVLVTKMGDPPGDADVFPDNQPDSIITADCIKIRCWLSLMMPQFLSCAINSQTSKKQIALITKGVAQKKVSLGRFSAVAVPVPSLAEQMEIITRFEQERVNVIQQEEAVFLGLKQLEAQRNNILKSAFAGGLVPQDPNDKPAEALLKRIKEERQIDGSSPRPRRTKKKAVVMQKADKNSLKKWVLESKSEAFTFDEVRKEFGGDYEAIKDAIFDLLGDNQPTIEQFFDAENEGIAFRRASK